MTNELKISIIIPVKDHTGFLTKLLTTIREHAPSQVNYEIIVVDDGSRENLDPLVTEYQVLYHREETSKGPAHARNVGAEMASAPLFFFLDADLEYPQGLMEHALSLLQQEPELAAISFIDHPYCVADGIIKNYGALIENYFYNKMVDGRPVARIQGFTTRNGIVKAEAFRAIGGFNESYTTNAMEDYEFGKRLAARFPVAMSNGPLIYHNFPTRLSGMLRNYWVRARLFVPYYLQHRPPLDKAMTSGDEALLRLLGTGALGVLVLALALGYFLILPTLLLGSIGGVLLLLYIYFIKEFLKSVIVHTGKYGIVLSCLGIHLLSSVVIVLGSLYGLAVWCKTWFKPNHAADVSTEDKKIPK